VDAQSRSDVLIAPFRHLDAAVRLARAAALLVAAGCGGNELVPPPDLPAVGRQVSLLRFPRSGGPVEAFVPESLVSAGWRTNTPAPPLRHAIGVDLDERMAYAIDMSGNLVGIDLESGGVRRGMMADVRSAAMGPDGSLFVATADKRIVHLVRRAPVVLTEPLSSTPAVMFGTVSGHLVAVTEGDARGLLITGSDRAVHEEELPEGRVAATYWGELVAVAADTAVLLIETTGDPVMRSIRVSGGARDVVFSPSGHRLYVARDTREVLIMDRYGLAQRASIRLPDVPRAIRTDASGRWLLARAAEADSVWVVDLATSRATATIATEWGPDLPLVAGAATLVTRQAGDIVSWDLRAVPAKRLATLVGAGPDSWLAAAWVPRDRRQAAVTAAETAIVTQDSALAIDSSAAEPDSTEIYVQVSTSQNEDWSEELAASLRDSGIEASVLKPSDDQEAYRVVIGPFQTREAADEMGRRLSRPYFILRLPRKSP
jgi:DNA-binding beta-propeller fold protein YncE